MGLSELARLVEQGKSAEELMAEFNIPSRSLLNSAMLQVMQQVGEEIQFPGLIGRASIDAG